MNNAIDSTDLEVRSDQYVCLEGNEPPKCPVTRCNDPTKCQACEGTGELDLDWVGSDPGILLGACQGDCNTDSDCDGDIKCYHDQIPPGCVGSMDAGQDYCGNPLFSTSSGKSVPVHIEPDSPVNVNPQVPVSVNPQVPNSVNPETPLLVFDPSIKEWYHAHYYELSLFLVSLLVVLCVVNVCVVMNRPRRKVKVYAPVKYMESETESPLV